MEPRGCRTKKEYENCSLENDVRRLGFVKKRDNWVPHELREIHLTQRIYIVYNNINRKRSRSKHPRSWLNKHKPYRKLSCVKKRSRCQFGGITKVSLVLNCFQINEQSTQLFTANNLRNWRKHSKRKDQDWRMAKEPCSATTMPGPTHL